MVCRNKEMGEAALSKIQSATGNKNVHLEVFLSCVLLCRLNSDSFPSLIRVIGRFVIFLLSARSSLLLPVFA